MDYKTKLTMLLNDYYINNGTTELNIVGRRGVSLTYDKKLQRKFNKGMGLLEFAIMYDSKLLINESLLSVSEKLFLKENLKTPYQLVSLGYPDYYTKGLISIYTKR